MASQRDQKLAETVLEYVKKPLIDDENEDESESEDDTKEEDRDDESGAAREDEDEIIEDDESESEKGSNEEDRDDQDGEKEADGEKAKETKSKKDSKSKKSSKGIGKKIKGWMGAAIDPFVPKNRGSKVQWDLDVNLKASNKKDQLDGSNDPKAGTSGTKTRKTADRKRDGESLSPDAKRIKRLEKDKKLLARQASKLREELEEKKSELSKMEEQLSVLKDDNDRVKAEMRDKQQHHQGVTCRWETQNEKLRNEVKRLDSELTNTTELLEKMKLTNLTQMEESCKLSGDMESISKAKAELLKQLEQKELSYRSELDTLKESLEQKDLENTELTDRVDKMKVTNQKQEEEASRLREDLESISKAKDSLKKEMEDKEQWYVSRYLDLQETLREERMKNHKDGDRLERMRYANPMYYRDLNPRQQ